MSKFFEDLKEGLEEILAFKEGKISLTSEDVFIPEPPKELKPIKIKKIRKNLNYSQGMFAKYLNVSPKTVQSWEAGIRKPQGSALRLLEIFDRTTQNILQKKN